jgi:carboxyl-terminal processing protease
MHPAPHLRMRKLFLRLARLAFALCLAASGSFTAAIGQQPMQLVPQPNEMAGVGSSIALPRSTLVEGKRLEQERRWQEAIMHYERALKKDASLRECTERLQICRVHFDVTRRYSDRSFIQKVDISSTTEAFQVFSEVLAKLDVYYVEPIDYYKLALHGTAFLEVALTEQDFLGKHLQNADAATVENFRKSIHKVVFGRKIQSVDELRNTVAQVANIASQQIGLMPSAVIYEYIAGSVGLLDPYSALLTPGEYREVMSQIEGNLIGLGVELWAEGTELRIVDVFRGGPAQLAGMTANQHIVQVDGQPVQQIGAKKAADLLRGTEGSKVRLVLRTTDDRTMDIEVERKRVDVPSVSVSEIASPGVGYIRITNFQKTTAAEVSRAMWSLSQEGMRSVIIDLRRNPGGLLDSAVDLADQFLSRGSIVSTHGRNGQENRNFEAKPPAWDIPLVVLIDADSASASEIFAGAIHDHDRGTVVGVTSYGKGSVQGVFHNEHGNGGLRLTVSKFFSPKGTPISSRGVRPHITVDEENLETGSVDVTAFKPGSESSRFVSKVEKKDYAKQKAIEVATDKVRFSR